MRHRIGYHPRSYIPKNVHACDGCKALCASFYCMPTRIFNNGRIPSRKKKVVIFVGQHDKVLHACYLQTAAPTVWPSTNCVLLSTFGRYRQLLSEGSSRGLMCALTPGPSWQFIHASGLLWTMYELCQVNIVDLILYYHKNWVLVHVAWERKRDIQVIVYENFMGNQSLFMKHIEAGWRHLVTDEKKSLNLTAISLTRTKRLAICQI